MLKSVKITDFHWFATFSGFQGAFSWFTEDCKALQDSKKREFPVKDRKFTVLAKITVSGQNHRFWPKTPIKPRVKSGYWPEGAHAAKMVKNVRNLSISAIFDHFRPFWDFCLQRAFSQTYPRFNRGFSAKQPKMPKMPILAFPPFSLILAISGLQWLFSPPPPRPPDLPRARGVRGTPPRRLGDQPDSRLCRLLAGLRAKRGASRRLRLIS